MLADSNKKGKIFVKVGPSLTNISGSVHESFVRGGGQKI